MSTSLAVEQTSNTTTEVTYALRHKKSGEYVFNHLGTYELNDCDSAVDYTDMPDRFWRDGASYVQTTRKGHAGIRSLNDAVRYVVAGLSASSGETMEPTDFELVKIESTHVITVEPVE